MQKIFTGVFKSILFITRTYDRKLMLHMCKGKNKELKND